MEGTSAADTSKPREPPLFALEILRKATPDKIDFSNKSELSRRVHEGVLLEEDEEEGKAGKAEKAKDQASSGEDQGPRFTHKYRVDQALNKNCWTVLAKALKITSDSDIRYWKWIKVNERSYGGEKQVWAAELKNICRLEIKGKCKSIMLSPKTAYEVKIVLQMKPERHGWEVPVNLSLTLPDGNRQVCLERLDRLEKGKWHNISMGKFETTPKTVGEISFSLTQTDGHWKSGLVVKGVEFTPIR